VAYGLFSFDALIYSTPRTMPTASGFWLLAAGAWLLAHGSGKATRGHN